MLDEAAAASPRVRPRLGRRLVRWIAGEVLDDAGRDAEAAPRFAELVTQTTDDRDVTTCLVAGCSLAGCLTRLEPELLGAVHAAGQRAGFSPLDRVQFGGPDDVESVLTRLTPAASATATERGHVGGGQLIAEIAVCTAVPAPC